MPAMKPKKPIKTDPDKPGRPSALIVEDTRVWREILHQAFRDAGYDPVWVETFQQALKAASEQRFGLISLDLDLKDQTMLGRMFLQLMPPANRHTPVLIVTGVLDPNRDESLSLNFPQVRHIFLKQQLVLSEFKKTVGEILTEAQLKPTEKKGLRTIKLTELRSTLKKKLQHQVSELNHRSRSSSARLLFSTFLGLFVYGIITLPLLWLTRYSPGDLPGPTLLVWNLATAAIALVYILLVSGFISNKQAVSIILALLSAISATKLFSSQGEQGLMDLLLERKNALREWINHVFTRPDEK
jgi:CheY-like chemotaxis protein